MARLKVTTAFRMRLSEKLMDLGNYVAAGWIIGQLAVGQFSLDLLILGFVGTIELYLAAFIISS